MMPFVFSILLAASLNTPTSAILNSPDTITHKEIKEVTVYGPAYSLALPAVSVNKNKLEIRNFNTPADVLRNETGISLSRDGIWATSINVRGFSEQRLLFMVDGDRIQTATDIAASLSTVDMNSLEKIEVIKGAASVLYGSGAMGGVVNFVLKRPAYSPLKQVSGKVSTGFQLVNNLWSSNADVQVTDKNWYLLADGSYRTAQNTKTPPQVLLNSQFNDASFGVRGAMKYSDNQELLVSYNHFKAWNVGLPGSSVFPNSATVKYTGVERNQLSGEYIFRNLSFLLKEFRFKGYTQNISRNVENRVNVSKLITPSSKNSTSGVKATGNLYFNDYNTMIVGAEVWNRKSETLRWVINSGSNASSVAEQPTPPAQMLDAGVFAQYNWKISPRIWEMNAGLRLDFTRLSSDTAFIPFFRKIYETSSYYNSESSDKYTLDYSIRKVAFLPHIYQDLSYSAHVDLLCNPASNQQFVLMLSNSYRAASIEERFKYIDLGSGIHKGNPDLKPEKGLFSNLSHTFIGNGISVRTDVFANYLFDLITEVKMPVLTSVYENQNIDQAFFLGAELEFNWLINKNISFNTNASYVRARDVKTENFLPQILPLHGLMVANYKSPRRFMASISAQWAGRQSEVTTTESATDGYVVYNVDIHSFPIQLQYTKFQLFAGVDNILNTEYYNHLTTIRNGGQRYAEPGRNIFLKVQLLF